MTIKFQGWAKAPPRPWINIINDDQTNTIYTPTLYMCKQSSTHLHRGTTQSTTTNTESAQEPNHHPSKEGNMNVTETIKEGQH